MEFHDPLWMIPRTLTWFYSAWIRMIYPFASLGHNVSIHYTCDVRNPARMRIGNFVTVHKDAWIHAQLPDPRPVDPALIIEDNCFIGRRTHISARNCVHIETGVMLASSVFVGDNDHEFSDISTPIRYQGMTEGGRIRIGQGSWIGQNAVILCEKGELNLGRNCVVAANSVVTRSAPAYSVLSGNPARIVKHYDPSVGAWMLGTGSSAEIVTRPLAVAGR
jgi:acetyltransferase-like isoleucine patch superfamily enzyme